MIDRHISKKKAIQTEASSEGLLIKVCPMTKGKLGCWWKLWDPNGTLGGMSLGADCSGSCKGANDQERADTMEHHSQEISKGTYYKGALLLWNCSTKQQNSSVINHPMKKKRPPTWRANSKPCRKHAIGSFFCQHHTVLFPPHHKITKYYVNI